MNLAIFGASGPTGHRLVSQALAAGHHVTAVTRRPHEYPMSAPELQVVAADATDPTGVARVFATPQHAVVSTLGVPYSRRPVTVYSRAITCIIQQMTAHGVDRLVCVSSTTVATTSAPGETFLWRRAVTPLLRHVVGRTLYDDMQRMEAVVAGSDVTWTVVRPGGLFDTDQPSEDRQVSPGRLPGRLTSRADLAATLLDEATHPQHPCSTVEVITRSGLPTAPGFIRDAFVRRRR